LAIQSSSATGRTWPKSKDSTGQPSVIDRNDR
jgi:hypothetical protein